MHALADYALTVSMIAAVLGAAIVCALIARYGFSLSDEQPAGERRRRRITRAGRSAAAACFGVAALAAGGALALTPDTNVTASARVSGVTSRIAGMLAALGGIRDSAERLRSLISVAPRDGRDVPLRSAREGGSALPAQAPVVPPPPLASPAETTALGPTRPLAGIVSAPDSGGAAAIAVPRPPGIVLPQIANEGRGDIAVRETSRREARRRSRDDADAPRAYAVEARPLSPASVGEAAVASPPAPDDPPIAATPPTPRPEPVVSVPPSAHDAERPRETSSKSDGGDVSPDEGPSVEPGRRRQRDDDRVRVDPGERSEGDDRAQRGERGERSKREDDVERHERSEQTERNDREERATPIEPAPRGEPRDRAGRVDREDSRSHVEGLARPDVDDRMERSRRPERSDRTERLDRVERLERVERPERVERIERAERPERPERGRPERIERPERRGRR